MVCTGIETRIWSCLLALAALFSAVPSECRAQVEPWPPPFPMVSTPVDVNGDVGRSCSMMFRPNGDPVVAYYDATLGALKLAERIQNVWHSQFITPVEGGVFKWCALALDLEGNPHVVYAPQVGLRHLVRVGGFWTQDTIPVRSGGLQSWDGTVAMDASGRLHVSFFLYPTGLYYAKQQSLGWLVEPVEELSDAGVGQPSSLVLRPDGSPVIFARRGGLRLYTRDAGTWALDGALNTPFGPTSISGAVGKDGFLRVAYTSGGEGNSYASQTQVGWHFDPFPSSTANGVVRCLSLRLDDLDRPLIASIDGNRSLVRLAYGGPGQWQAQSVDSASTSGGPETLASCSLALDLQGFPRVAYYTGTLSGGDLRFAEGPAGLGVSGRSLHRSAGMLGAPHPNPARARGAVSIECHLAARSTVALALYDLSGRELVRGPLARMEPGSGTLYLDMPSIPSGLVVAALINSDGHVLASRRIAVLR